MALSPFLVLTPIRVHLCDVTEWTHVIFFGTKDLPRAQGEGPALLLPPCPGSNRSPCTTMSCGDPLEHGLLVRKPVECILGRARVRSVRARAVLAFRYPPDLQDELIAVGRIYGHS
jgi:hypothetical protein